MCRCRGSIKVEVKIEIIWTPFASLPRLPSLPPEEPRIAEGFLMNVEDIWLWDGRLGRKYR